MMIFLLEKVGICFFFVDFDFWICYGSTNYIFFIGFFKLLFHSSDPNPSLQNDLQGTGISSGAYRSTDTTSRSSNSRSRQLKSSPCGSNIHTLRHDEDDGRFNDRNAFWNGNSTQYGGDNDGKWPLPAGLCVSWLRLQIVSSFVESLIDIMAVCKCPLNKGWTGIKPQNLECEEYNMCVIIRISSGVYMVYGI